jgi:alpha-tubulin suppressor-like RCC1 family protein
MLRSKDGKIYVCGSNTHFKLGLDIKDTTVTQKQFKECLLMQEFRMNQNLNSPIASVSSVACGFSHSIALLEDGRVVSWGGTKYGKSGQKDSEKVADKWKPRPVEFHPKNTVIQEIAVG